jgi:hypothetical protein
MTLGSVGKAFVVVAVVRLGLRGLGWPKLFPLLDEMAGGLRQASSAAASTSSATEVAASVVRASRLFPGRSSCLAEALAGWVLLKREGLPAEVRIGVRRLPGGSLAAHAWVESGGRVLIGASESTYHAFPRPVC